MRPVGVLHLRLRVNVLNENLRVESTVTGGALGTLAQQIHRLNSTIGASTRRTMSASRKGATMCFGCVPKLTNKLRQKSTKSMSNDSDDDDFEEDLGTMPEGDDATIALDDIALLDEEIVVPDDEFYANLDAKILVRDSPPETPTSKA
jgi:hypothetical protein